MARLIPSLCRNPPWPASSPTPVLTCPELFNLGVRPGAPSSSSGSSSRLLHNLDREICCLLGMRPSHLALITFAHGSSEVIWIGC